MKFAYKVPPFIKTVLIILCVAEVGTIIYFLAKIFNLLGLMSNFLPGEITVVIVCAIALAFCISMLCLNYRITATHLHLQFAFWDLLAKRIAISKILNIVLHKEEQHLYLSYIGNNQDPTIVMINIAPKRMESFVKALKVMNEDILYTEE